MTNGQRVFSFNRRRIMVPGLGSSYIRSSIPCAFVVELIRLPWWFFTCRSSLLAKRSVFKSVVFASKISLSIVMSAMALFFVMVINQGLFIFCYW